MEHYPILANEIVRRGIKKRAIARSIGICDKTLNNKLSGKTSFTWPEVKAIRHQFFPDMEPDVLFQSADESNEQ